MTSDNKKPAPADRCLSRLVRLSAEDVRNLKEACGRRGYALPRMNPRTGTMLNDQWKSWKKLSRLRLAEIEPSGGEAENLLITAKGRLALANDQDQTAAEGGSRKDKK